MKKIQSVLFIVLCGLCFSCSSMVNDAGDIGIEKYAETSNGIDDSEDTAVVTPESEPPTEPVPVFSVSGRVDNGPRGAIINLMVDNTVVSTTVNDGAFIVPDLSVGIHRVSVSSPDFSTVPAYVDIEIVNTDISDITFFADNITWNYIIPSQLNASINSILYDSNNGNYVVAGYQRVTGKSSQISISAYRQETELWSQIIGDSSTDEAVKIIKNISGGYAVVANSVVIDPTISVPSESIRLLCLDATGVIISNTIFGGASADSASDLIAVSDGYLVAGTTRSFATQGGSDWMIVKFDLSGNVKWKKIYGTSGDDGATAIKPYGDKYIVSSYVYDDSSLKTKIMVSIIDTEGGVSDSEIYYASNGEICDEYPSSLIVYNENIYIAASVLNRPLQGDDALLIKVDSELNEINRLYFGGTTDERLHDIVVTSNGIISLSGYTTKITGFRDRDSYLLMLHADCTLYSEQIFNNNSANDEIHSMYPLPSNGFIIGGYLGGSVSDNMMISCVNSNGEF